MANFEIQKYHQNKPKLNGVYLRNNLPKVKDVAYLINIDEFKWTETHWIALFMNAENVIQIDSFGGGHIIKEIRKFIKNKNVKTNNYWIQECDSVVCECFCIGLIDFMLKGESLLEYTNLFSLNEYEKNDKIISKYFQ